MALAAFGAVRRSGSSKIRRPEGGSLTGTAIAKKDFVTIDANGRVTLAVASGSNVGANTKLALAGSPVAAADATGSSIQVEYFDDEFTIELPVTNAGGTVNSNVNMVGKQYELRNVAGIWCVDTNATTNVKVEIIGFAQLNAYPIGTAFAPAICRIVPAARIAA